MGLFEEHLTLPFGLAVRASRQHEVGPWEAEAEEDLLGVCSSWLMAGPEPQSDR